MNVAELIAELQGMPQDAEVILENIGGAGMFIQVWGVKLEHDKARIEFNDDSLEYRADF